jgi:hypothetical protein
MAKGASVQMKYLKYSFVLLFVFCAVSATAQVPSGTFSYVFTNTPLWDVTGSYTNSSTINGASNDQTVDITQTAKGQITGSFNDTIHDDGAVIDVGSSIAGKISVKGGVISASLKLEDGTMTGYYTGTAKGGAILTFDAFTLTITNDYKLTLCEKSKKTKCNTYSGSAPFSVPAGVTGDWTLDTDITANGDKLSGTGTLTLSTGRAFTYKITGIYSTKSDAAKLILVGEGDAIGTSLLLTTQGTTMTLTTLKGKVLGQTPTFP